MSPGRRLRLRQEAEAVSARVAALGGERAALVEVRERLKAEEKCRAAELDTLRRECEELARVLDDEMRRLAELEDETRTVAQQNALLAEAVRALEERIDRVRADANALSERSAARRARATHAELAIVNAHGALARMEHRLRDGFGNDVGSPRRS